MSGRILRENRDFRLLWLASAISNLGDGLRLVALPLLTISITTDPVLVGGVTAATYAPFLLFSLHGGAMADRSQRRRTILVAQVTRGLAALAFAVVVANGNTHIWAIYALAFVIGTGEVLVDPSIQAAIPLVASDDIEEANSRLVVAEVAFGELAGGVLGGLLAAAAASAAFFVDGTSFLLAALGIAMINVPLQDTSSDDARASISEAIGEGFRFLIEHQTLRALAAASALSNLADGAFMALFVLLANSLGATKVQFGVMITVGAVGGLVGAALAPRINARGGHPATLVGALLLLATGFCAAAAANSLVSLAASEIVSLFAISVLNVAARSLRQSLTPNHLLGRVVATSRFIAFGCVPVGAIGGGYVARHFGIHRAVLGCSMIALLAALVLWFPSSTRSDELAEPAT